MRVLDPSAVRWPANVAAALIATLAVILENLDSELLGRLCTEDGLFETASAVFYFAASGLFVYVCSRYRFRNIWCWGYSALFFLVAGEEISWGQRMLGFGTPDAVEDLNVQEEFTLHNLEGIHGSVRLVSLIVIFGLCVVLPVTKARSAPARDLFSRLRLPVCPLWCAPVVLISFVLMAYPRLVLGRVVFNIDEVAEFLLSGVFLLFAVNEAVVDPHPVDDYGRTGQRGG